MQMKMNLVVLRQYFDEEETESISIDKALAVLIVNYPRMSKKDIISGLRRGMYYQTPGAVYWARTEF